MELRHRLKMRRIMPVRRLTELEGALLGAIKKRGPVTAYRLRRMFLDSPSLEWSGSAGAIYPAIRRLAKCNLVRAGRVRDGRGGRRHSLTSKGNHALTVWLCDANRAASPGIDPFRGRAGLWSTLAAPRRKSLMRSIFKILRARCAELKVELIHMDTMSRRQAQLEFDLHQMRLRWLRKFDSL
jgi:DNA-binding PadR family transcriptional regulator